MSRTVRVGLAVLILAPFVTLFAARAAEASDLGDPNERGRCVAGAMDSSGGTNKPYVVCAINDARIVEPAAGTYVVSGTGGGSTGSFRFVWSPSGCSTTATRGDTTTAETDGTFYMGPVSSPYGNVPDGFFLFVREGRYSDSAYCASAVTFAQGASGGSFQFGGLTTQTWLDGAAPSPVSPTTIWPVSRWEGVRSEALPVYPADWYAGGSPPPIEYIATCDEFVTPSGFEVDGEELAFFENVDVVVHPGDELRWNLAVSNDLLASAFDWTIRVGDNEYVVPTAFMLPESIDGDERQYWIDLSDFVTEATRVGTIELECGFGSDPPLFYMHDESAMSCDPVSGHNWCLGGAEVRPCTRLLLTWPTSNTFMLAGDTFILGFELPSGVADSGVENLALYGFHDDTGLDITTVVDRDGDALGDGTPLIEPGWEGSLEHTVVSAELWSEDVSVWCYDAWGQILIAPAGGLPDRDGGVVGGADGEVTPGDCMSGSGIGINPSSWLPAAGRMGVCIVRVLVIPTEDGLESFVSDADEAVGETPPFSLIAAGVDFASDVSGEVSSPSGTGCFDIGIAPVGVTADGESCPFEEIDTTSGQRSLLAVLFVAPVFLGLIASAWLLLRSK